MNKHQSTNFKNASALFLIIISLLASSAFAAAPANAVFTGAQLVTPSATINFNSTDSPSTASITLCDETTIASAFMWYEIPAVSYVRTISVDTCNTDFDTVLGVFSGSSYASLSVIACNDDRVSVYGDSCYPTSSFIDNINIASGEVIYVVMGGYKNTTSGIADSGVGQIAFTLISADNVPCTGALINETQLAIQNKISSVQTDLQTALSSTESFLNSSISTATTTISSDMSSSFGYLSGNVSALQNSANNIESSVTSANTEINVLQTNMTSISGKLDTFQTNLTNYIASVSSLSSNIASFNSTINSQFSTSDSKIAGIQTTANDISTAVGTLDSSVGTAQTTINTISSDVTTFSDNVNQNFTDTQTAISNLNSHISSVSSQLTSNTTNLGSALSTSDSDVASAQSDANTAINYIDNMQQNVNTDRVNNLFENMANRYLSNPLSNPPNSHRIPNSFGGQMTDVYNQVVNIYNSQVTAANQVGAASSSNCINNSFCNYFNSVAKPAYADSIAKYNSYVAALKFKTAYSYLQKAYSSLFPIYW